MDRKTGQEPECEGKTGREGEIYKERKAERDSEIKGKVRDINFTMYKLRDGQKEKQKRKETNRGRQGERQA